jgi:hypothetical protein
MLQVLFMIATETGGIDVFLWIRWFGPVRAGRFTAVFFGQLSTVST